MRTIEIKAYQFAELSETAKQKALEWGAYINVDHDWWDFTEDDAERVGIKITSFDIERRYSCNGDFTENAEDVAKAIIEEHGDQCETYKTATAFMVELAAIEEMAKKDYAEFSKEAADIGEEFYDFENFFENTFSDAIEEMGEDFKKSILEDYRIILRKEYEYLTSEEAIIETLEANGYEFTEEGKRI